MILSNEPGYYKAGHFGIRIENLVVVVPQAIAGAEEEMLGFETITFAPIARDLVEPALLSPAEADWLDAYHAQVFEKLALGMREGDRAWLEAACAPRSEGRRVGRERGSTCRTRRPRYPKRKKQNKAPQSLA